MRLTGLDIAIFAVYIVAVLGLGLYAATSVKRTKRDYFLAGDKLPWWMIGGSIVASNISSHHFVGVMGTGLRPRLRRDDHRMGRDPHRLQRPAVDLPAVLPPQRLLHDARVPREPIRPRGAGPPTAS